MRRSAPPARGFTAATAVLTCAVLAAVPAHAQTQTSSQAQGSAPPYHFSGLVFGDYYGFLDHHLPEWEGQHGFWLRRLYFTYDHTFSPQITTRFRLEANSNGDLEGGLLTPYVKDAYLRWTFTGRQQLTLGIQPSISIEFTDDAWGLRHIEKTPLDLYRVDSSRDTGVTLAGPLNEAQTFKYQVQYGNESGNSAETDGFKAVRAAVRYDTNPGLSAELMVGRFAHEDDADWTLVQGLAVYRGAAGRLGFQYAFQQRRSPASVSAPRQNLDVYSGFGVYDIRPQKLSVFARVDRFADPCEDCGDIDYLPIDASTPFTLALAGLEYYIHPAVRLSPNVEYVAYGNPASAGAGKPPNDTVLRLTFYWVW
jgi:hypothetical protein